jgi:flavodoxin I
MKTLVVYDSVYGNTKIVAQAIADAIPGEVQMLRVGEAVPSDLKVFDLLIVGSPTQGGRPTEAMQGFLKQGHLSSLQGMKVAAFDTRLTAKWVRIFSYAAPRIASSLQEKGGTLLGAPGGFFVKGTKGPLLDGEVEKAIAWAKGIAESET